MKPLDFPTVPECADPATLIQELETALRTAFNLRIPVSLAPAGTLPRFELKANRWIRTEGVGYNLAREPELDYWEGES